MWLYLALLSALFHGFHDLLAKKLLNKHDPFKLALVTSFVTFIASLSLVVYIGFPAIGAGFWPAYILVSVISSITTILIFKAYSRTDLSLAAPIISLSPVFLLITSPIILGEYPTLLGLLGVCLVLVGTYVLSLKKGLGLRGFRFDGGQKFVILACALWAISSNYYKIGMKNSSPLFFIMAVNGFILVAVATNYFFKIKKVPALKAEIQLLPLGILAALATILEFVAISQGLVVYVLTVKRLSIIVTVFGAHYIFKEKELKKRIFASLIMLLGIILIGLRV